MGEREREREREKSVEKCCFCLQNDLKNHTNARSVYCIYCLSKSLVYGIYRNYQKMLGKWSEWMGWTPLRLLEHLQG